MGMQLPAEAQEKVEELQGIQEELEQITEQEDELSNRLQSAQQAQDVLDGLSDDSTVYRQVDELIFELDSDDAEDHIGEKVDQLSAAADSLEQQSTLLQKKAEEIQTELEALMGQQPPAEEVESVAEE